MKSTIKKAKPLGTPPTPSEVEATTQLAERALPAKRELIQGLERNATAEEGMSPSKGSPVATAEQRINGVGAGSMSSGVTFAEVCQLLEAMARLNVSTQRLTESTHRLEQSMRESARKFAIKSQRFEARITAAQTTPAEIEPESP